MMRESKLILPLATEEAVCFKGFFAVVPAQAGVILGSEREMQMSFCCSRASGGDPPIQEAKEFIDGLFPRKRG